MDRHRLVVPMLSLLLAACAGAGSPASTVISTSRPPTQPPPLPSNTPAATATASEDPADNLLISDFEPPAGYQPGAPPESPGEFRLLSANSSDGLNFTGTGEVLIDQANVPDLLLGDGNRLFLYFTGGQMGARNNVTAVAISDDLGQTWIYKYVVIRGLSSPNFVDPDVVRLPDGTYRLYFTAGSGPNAAIHYADGSDGVTFDYGGVSFSVAGSNVIDSSTAKYGDVWRMFVLDGETINQFHGTSSDGRVFASNGHTPFVDGGEAYVASNVLTVEGGYRMFGFSIPRRDIRSFFSPDGAEWAAEAGVRLAYDPNSAVESQYVKDPTILQMPDGTYLMVYVSKIPR